MPRSSANPSFHNMAKPSIFTNEQLVFIRRSYLSHGLPPREVARECNLKFQTSFTAKQISSLLAERGLTKTRKLAKARVSATSNVAAVAEGIQKAAAAPLKEMIEGHLRIGGIITSKAEKFAVEATSAKTLSSAASAARAGIAIVREAAGMTAGTVTIPLNISFFDPGRRSDLSPFSAAGQERARLAAMKRAEIVPEEHNVDAIETSVSEENLASG